MKIQNENCVNQKFSSEWGVLATDAQGVMDAPEKAALFFLSQKGWKSLSKVKAAPAKEEPKIEEPKVEEPKVEPKVEEPKAEVVEEKKPKWSRSKQ